MFFRFVVQEMVQKNVVLATHVKKICPQGETFSKNILFAFEN